MNSLTHPQAPEQSCSNHLERGGGDQIGEVDLWGGGREDGHAVASVHGVQVRVPGRVKHLLIGFSGNSSRQELTRKIFFCTLNIP